jgi:hypothetical protein
VLVDDLEKLLVELRVAIKRFEVNWHATSRLSEKAFACGWALACGRAEGFPLLYGMSKLMPCYVWIAFRAWFQIQQTRCAGYAVLRRAIAGEQGISCSQSQASGVHSYIP